MIGGVTKLRRDSRRSFITSASASLAAIAAAHELLATAEAAQDAPPVTRTDPEVIVVNARVYTMDARTPRAQAFAITGRRFSAVGASSEIRALAGKSTVIYD